MSAVIRWSFAGALSAALLFVCGCAGTKTGSAALSAEIAATVELSGSSNAPITGYYIAKGRRVKLTGRLPITISASGLSEVAVRKLDSQDNLVVTAQTRNGSVTQSVPPRLDEGVRVMLYDLSVSVIPPQESLEPPEKGLIVIKPYWDEGTWVFDDPARGLQREPFVRGAPEMIDALVKDIPNARDGFRLTFSTKPFRGFQKKLIWVRAEAGGNYYRFSDKPMQGWLCPAMFRYFTKTPKVLYLKAEPKKV